jgi:ATP-dependent Clp protease adaptor protein ClpS
MSIAMPEVIEEIDVDSSVLLARPWIVIVWDDPVNTMEYVTKVFMKLFGFSRTKAEKHMREVHFEGRSVVSSGTKEKAELDVFRLGEHGLLATMEQQT